MHSSVAIILLSTGAVLGGCRANRCDVKPVGFRPHSKSAPIASEMRLMETTPSSATSTRSKEKGLPLRIEPDVYGDNQNTARNVRQEHQTLDNGKIVDASDGKVGSFSPEKAKENSSYLEKDSLDRFEPPLKKDTQKLSVPPSYKALIDAGFMTESEYKSKYGGMAEDFK